MTLSLPDVTLCAVTSVNHELTARAINECLKHCSFADVVMISSEPVKAPFRVEVVPRFTGAEYAPFVCRNLAKYTPSAFNLLVQYDGYVVDSSAWTDKFFEYDYIGAKWPWHPANRRVGNSGFCLRSKKLLEILAEIDLPPTGSFVDDTFICHIMREQFENNYGIKIAPENIADDFSYERHVPDRPTFGFHGMFNYWRHIGDDEMEKIPYRLDDQYVGIRPFVEVLLHSYTSRKARVFHSWFDRMVTRLGDQGAKDLLLGYVKNLSFIEELMENGERVKNAYGSAENAAAMQR